LGIVTVTARGRVTAPRETRTWPLVAAVVVQVGDFLNEFDVKNLGIGSDKLLCALARKKIFHISQLCCVCAIREFSIEVDLKQLRRGLSTHARRISLKKFFFRLGLLKPTYVRPKFYFILQILK
jgi:hypothetical protein